MGTIADVERISLALPEAEEGTSYGSQAWKVRRRTFAWERPLRQRDKDELGDATPGGIVLGVRAEDELAKQVLCENEGPAVFTVAHFDGFSAVLIDLEAIEPDLLEDLITDSWRAMAPARLVKGFDGE